MIRQPPRYTRTATPLSLHDALPIWAETLASRGLRMISGRTESHMFMVDLRPKGLTGKAADAALGQAHITVNKNAIPNDPESRSEEHTSELQSLMRTSYAVF